MSYKLFNNKKNSLITLSSNVKHMGYRKQCINCECPIFEKETVCPECNSRKIKRL